MARGLAPVLRFSRDRPQEDLLDEYVRADDPGGPTPQPRGWDLSPHPVLGSLGYLLSHGVLGGLAHRSEPYQTGEGPGSDGTRLGLLSNSGSKLKRV